MDILFGEDGEDGRGWKGEVRVVVETILNKFLKDKS
jgi:hypothetical protein